MFYFVKRVILCIISMALFGLYSHIHADASQKADLYEAIDDVRTEMIRALSSAKDKNTTLFRRGAQKVKNILKGFRS